MRTQACVVLCGALAALTLTAVVPSGASAARGHVFDHSFAEPGSGPGQLSEPDGLAVSEASGVLYVVDKGNNRVQRFNGETGAFLGQFDGSGSFEPEPGTVQSDTKAGSGGLQDELPTGKFKEPEAIAVDNACFLHQPKLTGPACAEFDPSNGDVYVVDSGHGVLDKFTASGKYVGQITRIPRAVEFEPERFFRTIYGLGVDPRGELWLAEEHVDVLEFGVQGVDNFGSDPTNEFIEYRKTNNPNESGFQQQGFAVDSQDDFYLSFGNVFAKYDPRDAEQQAGSSLKNVRPLNGVSYNPPEGAPVPGGLAVEPTTDDLYIDHGSSFERLDPEGNLLEELAVPGAHGTGIAADFSRETVYVADSEAGLIDEYTPEPPGAPTVSPESSSASEVSAEAATLRAQLNPHGAESTYEFQYGACESSTTCLSAPFDHSAPQPPSQSGSGFELESLSIRLQGLEPSTTYHARLFAENTHGEGAGEEVVFATQATGGTPSLLDSRAWELVSPPEKRGALIEAVSREGGAVEASASGGAITYLANAATEAGPQGGVEKSQLLSARSPSGWRTADIAPPYTAPEASGPSVGEGQQYRAFSEDLSTAVDQPFGAFEPKLSPQASEQTPFLRTNFPVGEPLDSCASSCFQPLVSGAPGFANVPEGTHFGEEGICPSRKLRCGPQFQGASPDANHVVIRSEVGLSAGEGSGGGLYEWDRATGRLAFIGAVPKPGDGLGRFEGNSAPNAISADGSHVFFQGESEGLEGLLMRDVAAGKTLKLDQAEALCGGCESGGGVFQTASRDGSTAFFTSDHRLTAGSGAEPGKPDLYACRIEEQVGSPTCDLTDLTPADPGGEAADVLGSVLGASADGSDVFFAADGVQGPSPGAVQGECSNLNKPHALCNLYLVRREGAGWSAPRLVAVLSTTDHFDWVPQIAAQPTRVSPDGEWLAFLSTRPLAGFDNRDAQSGEPLFEAYLYDAATEQLECASCAPSGERPIGAKAEKPGYQISEPLAGVLPGWTTFQLGFALHQPRYLSDSGRLFFAAADRLVPADVNGALDVYEFEPQGLAGCGPAAANPAVVFKGERAFSFEGRPGSEPPGCIGLISSGTSNVESEFLDASASGDDVFFRTSAQLGPTDVDNAPDVYDARIGGGFPQPASPPICQGDACQQPAAPPGFENPGTALLEGPENVKQCPKGKVKKSGKCVAKKSKKHKHKKGKKNAQKRTASHKGGGSK